MIPKKLFNYFIGIAVIVTALIFQNGCSNSSEQQAEEIEEKGKIEQMTDEVAEKAVKKIRTPINKARDTQNLGDERLESMDKAMQQQ